MKRRAIALVLIAAVGGALAYPLVSLTTSSSNRERRFRMEALLTSMACLCARCG